eukprot:419360-Pelagomonas_calceolata.AAC.2
MPGFVRSDDWTLLNSQLIAQPARARPATWSFLQKNTKCQLHHDSAFLPRQVSQPGQGLPPGPFYKKEHHISATP